MGKTIRPLRAGVWLLLTLLPLTAASALRVPNAKPAAPGVAPGGANQRPSLGDCIGDQLFNGVWRLRVTRLERIVKDGDTPGWGLTVEVRNGTRTTMTLVDAGVNFSGQGMQLAFPDATTLAADPLDVQQLTFATLPQGGAATHQLKFYFPSGTSLAAARVPSKFLFEVDPKGIGFSEQQRGVAFTTPTPSFRVRLNCTR